MDFQRILSRIDARLKDIEMSPSAASKLATGSPDTIRNWHRAVKDGRDTGMTLTKLSQLAGVIGKDVSWLISDTETETSVSIPVMGYLGAGAEVEPDFEQVPPEGLETVELPFGVAEDLIAFRVKGTSMLPFYKEGSVIVVYREQKKPLESFYGEEAAVRTRDGRRFIKTIMRGESGVNLISWNAAPIENVHLEWIGEIFANIPASALRAVGRRGGVQGQLKLRA